MNIILKMTKREALKVKQVIDNSSTVDQDLANVYYRLEEEIRKKTSSTAKVENPPKKFSDDDDNDLCHTGMSGALGQDSL